MNDGSSRPAERVRQFFGAIAERYDLTNRVLSAGCDVRWRTRAAGLVREWQPGIVLDLATGSGDLAMALAAACPKSRVIAADFCPAMLARARAKGVRDTVVADALHLPFAPGTFDAITVAFGLRNMASWSGALCEMERVLRPGGRLLLMDFSLPRAPLLWLYRPYLRHLLPRLATLVTGQREVYEYFADSIERFPSGKEMRQLLASSGLHCEQQILLQGGIVTIHVAGKEVSSGTPA